MVFVCQTQVTEHEDKKEDEGLRTEDGTAAFHLQGKVVGVSMTKPSISIGSLSLISF